MPEFLKWIYRRICSCFWEGAMQECFQNKFVLRSSHQDTFFNIAVLQLWWNSLKNTCDVVQFLVNFHVTLSSFEPLLRKRYFITTLINAEQQLLQNTSRKLLLCLEAVVRRCSSKKCSEKFCKSDRKTLVLESVFNKVVNFVK